MSQRAATVASGAPPSIVSALAARLTVEIRPNLDLQPQDVAALDRLIEGRPDVGVFLSRAWLAGFFAEPPTGFDPSLVVLRERGILRGVVPIAVRSAPTHVRVDLLGGGIGSDRVDLLAARGFEAACSDRFLSWLGETFGDRGFILGLREVPADSSLWGAVYRANADRTLRLALQPLEIHTHPYLNVTEPEAFPVGGQPSTLHPRSLDKHRRWLDRRGRLRIEMLKDPGAVMAAFESLTTFLHARWRSRADGSVLDAPRMLRFHRQALPHLLGEGRLRMIQLRSDMRTIAVFYGVASAGWWGYYLAGYDREWAGRIRVGQITLAIAIDLASREGAMEFDFLKGAERVKYLWPVHERATVDADVYSEKPGAQFKRAAWATREAAAALTKSARSVFSK